MRFLTVLTALALSLAACGTGEDDTDDTDTDTDTTVVNGLRQAIAGVWGPDAPGLFQFGADPLFDSLSLRADGSGTLVYRGTTSDLLTCMDLRWAVVDDSVLLDFEANEITLYLFDGLYGVQVDDTSLALVSDLGLTSSFTRLDAVPDGGACGELAMIREIAGLADAWGSSNVVHDPVDNLFWYGLDDQPWLNPVNPTSAPLMLAPLRFDTSMLHALQAMDTVNRQFWFLENWDGNRLVCRDDTDTSCGAFDTAAMGSPITVAAAAIAGTHMWLHGRDTSGDNKLLEVDMGTSALLRTVALDVRLERLAWDGTDLWALVSDMGGPLVRIDLDNATIDSTWRAASYNRLLHDWNGLTFADGKLWVLMEPNLDQSSGTVLRQFDLVP